VAALAAAVLVGAVVEVAFVRRFSSSPRLVLTVATLGILGLVGSTSTGVMATTLIRLFRGQDAADDGLLTYVGRPKTPFSAHTLDWFPVRFTGDHLVILFVTLVVLGVLTAFFRLTNIGIAVRGSAQNADRAALLGVNVNNISTLVWAIAALLSAVASVLLVPVLGFVQPLAGGVAAGLQTLTVALAAAVLGRMDDIPLVVAAAFGISIFREAVFWAFDDASLTNVALLGVIVVAMLVQRQRLSRADEDVQSTWTATEEVRAIPAELQSVPTVRRGVRWFFGLVAAVAVAVPFFASPSQTNIASIYLIYGMVAVSLVILTGWGGQISLGQFAFVAIGAITGGSLVEKLHVPFPVALACGAVAGAVCAVAVGLPALRIRGLYLAVTTLGFSVVVATVLLNKRYFGAILPAGDLKRPTFLFVHTDDDRVYYFLCLVLLVAAVVAVEGLRRSRTGRVLIAMRDNERTAQSYGVNLVRVRLTTFAISGFIASGAGVLFAFHQHAVDSRSYAPDVSVQMFLMAVLGGLGSVRGVLLGAAYLGTIRVALSGPVSQLFAGAVGLLIVLLFFPGGLGWLAYRMRDAWLRRIALRFRILVPSLIGAWTGADRAAIAPKADGGNVAEPVPARYRLPSRIGEAGSSQETPVWRS
jgi:branched-chain amino acid transport system permease protein